MLVSYRVGWVSPYLQQNRQFRVLPRTYPQGSHSETLVSQSARGLTVVGMLLGGK